MSSGNITAEALGPEVARNYIGARGFGIYYLRREVDPACDPFGPQNKIIMAAGPLTGTAAPTGSRYVVNHQVSPDRGHHLFQLRRLFPGRAEKKRP